MTPSLTLVLKIFTELNKLDFHNFFTALLSFSPGISIASPFFNPEKVIMVSGLKDVLPVTVILPILYLSILFCEVIDWFSKKQNKQESKQKYLFILNLFTGFSKSSFSFLKT